jgi:hypothetical protein
MAPQKEKEIEWFQMLQNNSITLGRTNSSSFRATKEDQLRIKIKRLSISKNTIKHYM